MRPSNVATFRPSLCEEHVEYCIIDVGDVLVHRGAALTGEADREDVPAFVQGQFDVRSRQGRLPVDVDDVVETDRLFEAQEAKEDGVGLAVEHAVVITVHIHVHAPEHISRIIRRDPVLVLQSWQQDRAAPERLDAVKVMHVQGQGETVGYGLDRNEFAAPDAIRINLEDSYLRVLRQLVLALDDATQTYIGLGCCCARQASNNQRNHGYEA